MQHSERRDGRNDDAVDRARPAGRTGGGPGQPLRRAVAAARPRRRVALEGAPRALRAADPGDVLAVVQAAPATGRAARDPARGAVDGPHRAVHRTRAGADAAVSRAAAGTA